MLKTEKAIKTKIQKTTEKPIILKITKLEKFKRHWKNHLAFQFYLLNFKTKHCIKLCNLKIIIKMLRKSKYKQREFLNQG